MAVSGIRVAKVLDEYTVVLNKGARDGLAVGDKLLIFGIGEEILDPETGESLGQIELVRGRVKIQHLQDKICTARSSETIKIPGRKRTIQRRDSWAIALGTAREEIEEDHSFEDKPLDDPEVGDHVRPY
nr:hypothetical protein [uncultured Hyphomonas sp.]